MSFLGDITTDLRDIFRTTGFEMLKHIRQRRILIAVSIAIVLPLIFYAIPPLFGMDYSSTALDFASSNLNFITLFIVISGAIFAGDAVSGEFERKTGLLLFPTPQKHTSIYIGKYLAAILTLFSGVTIYYLMIIWEIGTIYGFSDIPSELGKSYLVALLYSTSVIGVIFFFSSIMKRAITSSLVGFFILMMILPIITSVLKTVSVDPWFIVTNGADLITNVLGQSAGGFGPGKEIGTGNTITPDFDVGVLVIFGYALSLFWASLIFANRRKME